MESDDPFQHLLPVDIRHPHIEEDKGNGCGLFTKRAQPAFSPLGGDNGITGPPQQLGNGIEKA
ncbi:MAG: hypothetical protein ABI876_15885, partial [Bacteroidota bacterium]